MRFPLKNPGWAAVLSFLLPGLGQAVGGKPTRGAIIAFPAVAFFFVFLPIFLFANRSLIGSSGTLTGLLFVDVIGCVYHVWAVVDAYREIKPPFVQQGMRGVSGRRASIPLEFAATVGLVVATIGVHAFFGAVDLNSCVMRGSSPCPETDPVAIAAATQSPRAPAQTPRPAASSSFPSATPTTGPSGSSSGAVVWMPIADRLRVHSGAGLQFATTKVLRQWQTITGPVVAGGAYTFAGVSQNSWIKIDKGQPGAGGFVAAGYFIQTGAPGSSPAATPGATPTPTPRPLTSPSPSPSPTASPTATATPAA